MKKPRWKRFLARGALASMAFVLVLICVVTVQGWRAFGRAAGGELKARVDASPQFRDGQFQNPQPLENDNWKMLKGLFGASPHGSPEVAPPTVSGGHARLQELPESGLRVTWLGHSTLLIEIDGVRVLTDPVWSERISPVPWVGPQRWYPPPIALHELPHVDAVVISHDHYDHLDYPTIVAMKDWDTTFVVPLGVGAHLTYWGVPPERIQDLDWWDRTTVAGLDIVCTPARHASGRTPFDNHTTLWASYALVGPRHRAYFSGDTGLFPALREIGERLGPFDLTMIEAGAYGDAWPDWHLGPEQAVKAHEMVRGRVLMPVHWGLFNLAYHGWTEPVERVLVAADRAGVSVVIPKPGQSIEPAAPPPVERWWPELPWRTAEQNPITSTKM